MRNFPIVVIALVAAAPLARAQDAVKVTEADLNQKAAWGDLTDKTVYLDNVKFKGFAYPEVQVPNVSTGKLFATAEKFPGLPNWRTPGGQTLDRTGGGRSNVKVVGVARNNDNPGMGVSASIGNGERYIEITDVQKLPDDIEQFKQRASKLTDSDELLKVAAEAKARADSQNDPPLAAWAIKVNEQALTTKQASLPKGDIKAAIDLAIKMKNLAQNAPAGIALLNGLYADPQTSAADKELLTRALSETLDAAQYQTKWIPREEFKRMLGYVARKDASGRTVWLRRERVEFDAEIEKERKVLQQDPNARGSTSYFYEQSASKGELKKGMFKTEVVRTKGFGFPDFVDRIEDPKKNPQDTSSTWDQWIMPDGTRLYFFTGCLFEIKAKADPWPDEKK